MQPQVPPNRKKRIFLALLAAAVPPVIMLFFFWPALQDMRHDQDAHRSKANLLMFGSFLAVVFLVSAVVCLVSAIRRPANPVTAVARPASGGKAGTIFLFLFATPFAAFGIFALAQALQKWSNGDGKDTAALALFGLVFCSVGLGLMIGAILSRKKSRQADELKYRNPDKPWLWRDDWAAGRVKSSNKLAAVFLWIFATFWNAIAWTVASVVVPQELHKGNLVVLLALIFPLVGLFLIILAVRATLVWRRFGQCFFELAQIPAPLGGTLEGQILVGTRLRLEHGLHLKLSCIRQVTTGSGKSSHTDEQILWQDEKVFRPEANLLEPEPGRTGIPVYFKLPADQPEATPGNGDGIHWQLEAKAKMSGPGFSAMFEVPVFQVAGAVTADADADEADPTAALQESVENIRREENSKIQVTDGPCGREFYFPAARNLGMAIGITIFFLVWSGIFYALLHSHAPVLFPIVWGVTDALLGWGCFNLWFKSSRVTIDSTGVRVVNRWLIFSRTRQFDATDIVRFDTKAGMTSGSQVFQDLKLFTKDAGDSFANDKDEYQRTERMPAGRFRITSPDGFTLAGSLASKPEADWLVREMTKALGRKA